MRKYLLCSILCLMLPICVGGCANQANRVETDEQIMIPDEIDEDTLGEAASLYESADKQDLEKLGEMVLSDDKEYQVLVPSKWELCENKVNENMMFEFQGETEDQYMGILVLEDESYGEFDIAAFMDLYAKNAIEEHGNAIIGEMLSVDVNGNQAYKLRITGTVNGIEYINCVYAVDYENEKVIFTASMYPANENQVVDTLEEVVVSFDRVITDDSE